MRPPDLPGGNLQLAGWEEPVWTGFNEAAGFTRRKQVERVVIGFRVGMLQ